MAPKFRVLIASMVASAVWMIAPTAHAAGCPFIALSDGCLYTNTGADTDDRFDGFPVTNVDGIPLWDFYQTLDPQDVGFPISQRFRLDGFLVQAFQKVILQWRPDSKSFQYVNTLDLLAERHPNVSLPFLPEHATLAVPDGASFGERTAVHLSVLNRNPEIRDAYLSKPNWLELYGLPVSYEVFAGGAVEVLRAQRSAFAIWRIEAPGIQVGQVVRQNIPDEIKRLSQVLIPDEAKLPSRQPSVDEILAKCPTAADIELVDGFLDLQFEADPSAGALVCAADSGSANLTGFQERAYHAVLLLRRIGFTRQLPWTDLALFDWFVEAIDGIRFKSDFPGFGYCCTPSRYMWINPSVMPDTTTWIGSDLRGMENFVRALVHEARHVHPSHRRHNCADGTQDLTMDEGGAYAVEVQFIESMALQGDGRFFIDLNGNPYRDDMLADADFVRRWRFCDEVMGVRVRNALPRNEQTTGIAGPRTTERWTYDGRAGESVRIVLSDDQLVIRLFAPGNLLVAQSASGSLEVVLPATGEYLVHVQGSPNYTNSYLIQVVSGSAA